MAAKRKKRGGMSKNEGCNHGSCKIGQKNTPVRKEKHRGEKERKKKLKKY
jgi:hypothetical protein